MTLRNQFDNLRVAADFSTPKDHKAAAEVEDAPSPLRKRYEATEPAAVQPNKSTTVKKLETLKALKGSSTSMFRMQFPELSRKVDAEVTNINAVLAQEGMELHLCEDESDGEEEIMATEEKVVIRAAMDSGSVASVIEKHIMHSWAIAGATCVRHGLEGACNIRCLPFASERHSNLAFARGDAGPMLLDCGSDSCSGEVAS